MSPIAKSLTNILNRPEMRNTIDRSKDINQTINDVCPLWKADLLNRRPAPALTENGTYQGSDLDLSTFLLSLSYRNAIINIPCYRHMRESCIKQGQRLVSKENRHGKIIGLTSNANVFSFGVRIIDANIINDNKIGDFRVFNITDMNGTWYPGWNSLEFTPDKDEDEFMKKFRIMYGNKLNFSYFVHPARSMSIFSADYFITKALIQRIDEEAKYLYYLIKDMLDSGVRYPSGGTKEFNYPPSTPLGDKKSIKVNAFEVKVEIPFINEYPMYPYNSESLKSITKKRRDLIHKYKPKLSFAVRCCELAYKLYNKERFPFWIKGIDWQSDYIESKSITISKSTIKKCANPELKRALQLLEGRNYKTKDQLINSVKEFYFEKFCGCKEITNELDGCKPFNKRTKWDKLRLFQNNGSEVSIRKRDYTKSEIVSSNY